MTQLMNRFRDQFRSGPALPLNQHSGRTVGDEADRHTLPAFARLPVVDKVGKLALVDSLCALRDVDIVVSHDTGPLHFARLVRTPVVGLFGPTDPRSVVGDDDGIEVLWGGANLACRPCYDGRNYARCSDNLCMKDVSVESVLKAVLTRVGSTRVQLTPS